MPRSPPWRGNGRPAAATSRYVFGDVVVDAAAHTLLRAGQPQTLEPKAFAVLLVLLQRAGELVGRDDLLDAVWGHRHVTPGVLTRAIAQLRHALDDDFQHPRYIQTQHALGYRFIGELLLPAEPGAGRGGASGRNLRRLRPNRRRPPKFPWRRLPDPAPAIPIRAAVHLVQTGPPAPAVGGARRCGADGVARHSPGAWRAVLAVRAVAALAWVQLRPTPAPQASIAVLPFTSLSSDRNDSYFAEGLAVEMHDALARVPGLDVVASRPASSAELERADARALGRRLGVANVLDASVRRDGRRVRISAHLVDTANGVTVWAGSYDRQVGGRVRIAERDRARSRAGLARRAAQRWLRRWRGGWRRPRSFVAYDAYLRGLQLLRQPGAGETLERAIGYFNEALSVDPVFARAQAGICRAEIARFESARDAAAFSRAETACVRASAMDPGLREVSMAMGDMYLARGDGDASIEHYTHALDDIALRPQALVGLARAHGAQGRNEQAMDYLKQARALRPNDAAIFREQGYLQYLSGDLPGAIDSFLATTRLEPDNERHWSSLGGLYLASGDTAGAERAFQRSLAIKPNYPALSNYGSLSTRPGATPRPPKLYRRAAELDPQDFRLWGNIGDALSALPGQSDPAGAAYRRAAQAAQAYVDIKADDAAALAQLGWYRANLGERGRARPSPRAEATGSETGEVAFWCAQALAVLGERPPPARSSSRHAEPESRRNACGRRRCCGS